MVTSMPEEPPDEQPGLIIPAVGAELRRLRQGRGMSLRTLAAESGISRSFLASVERGESDISIGRLAQIAHVLGKDVAALLGFAGRRHNPEYVREHEQIRLSRGEGVEFASIRVPHTNLELLIATFAPHSKLDETLSQPGVDVMYLISGELVLVFDGEDYPVRTGECVVWPSSRPETIVRNDSSAPSRAICFSIEITY